MCWSYEATLGFCVFESLVLLYIWRRDTLNDRINCIGHLPILGQEFLQLWMHVSMNEADTPQECSSDNRKVSFLIAAVVHASPFFMMMRGYWGALKAKSSSQLVCILQRGVKNMAIVYLGMVGITGYMMQSGSWESCTIKGPYGHQMWAMLMVPDPSLRLQAWIAPGWVESMPSVFPFPFFRVFCWIVYMSLASTAWEVNQRTDLGWRVLGLLGPVVCFGLIVFRGYEWGSMWCHFASLIVTLYLVAPWFENWRRRVGGRAPGKGCLVNTFAEFTEPSFVNAGWEHIYGWKEIPAMTARGIV
eukprot:gene23521-31043_t